MKRLVVFFTLFFLVGCSTQTNNDNRDEIIVLQEKMNHLKSENQKLNNILVEIKQEIDVSKNKYSDLNDISTEIKKKLNKFDFEIMSTDIGGLYMSTYRLRKYISYMPAYKEVLCFINEYNEEKNAINVDEFEWVDMLDENRIRELGLDSDHDFPNGYYFHNEINERHDYFLPEDTTFYLLEDVTYSPKYVDKETFTEAVSNLVKGGNVPFSIIVIDGTVVEVSRIFVP